MNKYVGFRFPEDFLIGTANSAFQSEGAWDRDGKSESNMDYYAKQVAGKPRGKNFYTEDLPDRGCFFYDNYEAYIEDMAATGQNTMEDKHADTKAIARFAGTTRLSFATPEKLMEVLHLIPGSVSPLGIINDTENRVKLLLDADLVGKQVIFHPNTNTKSLSLHFDDLVRFIEHLGHTYTLYPTEV